MNPAANGFLLSLSLCLDIGIVNIAMMSVSMERGYWTGFWLGLGSCIGDLIYAVLALAGMTVLLEFAVIRWGMWLGGTVVLSILALRMLVSAFKSIAADDTQRDAISTGRHWQQLIKGMLLDAAGAIELFHFRRIP